ERAGCMHRPEANQPFADVEPAHELHDAAGEIDQLDSLLRLHDEGLAVNRQAAGLRRSHVLHGRLANGDGRTFAHAFLSARGSGSTVRTRTLYVTQKLVREATRQRVSPFHVLSRRQLTLAPPGTP